MRTYRCGLCPVLSRGAEIVVAGETYVTDRRGEVRLDVTPGAIELTVVKDGFAPVTTTITVAGGQQQQVTIELEKLPTVQETVTVSATRTDRGLEDQPMRVEVLDAEEIDENLVMTPGDVVMMLNEMGGMRVPATSPSLGAERSAGLLLTPFGVASMISQRVRVSAHPQRARGLFERPLERRIPSCRRCHSGARVDGTAGR